MIYANKIGIDPVNSFIAHVPAAVKHQRWLLFNPLGQL